MMGERVTLTQSRIKPTNQPTNQASKQASKQATKQASKQATNQPTMQASNQIDQPTNPSTKNNRSPRCQGSPQLPTTLRPIVPLKGKKSGLVTGRRFSGVAFFLGGVKGVELLVHWEGK